MLFPAYYNSSFLNIVENAILHEQPVDVVFPYLNSHRDIPCMHVDDCKSRVMTLNCSFLLTFKIGVDHSNGPAWRSLPGYNPIITSVELYILQFIPDFGNTRPGLAGVNVHMAYKSMLGIVCPEGNRDWIAVPYPEVDI